MKFSLKHEHPPAEETEPPYIRPPGRERKGRNVYLKQGADNAEAILPNDYLLTKP